MKIVLMNDDMIPERFNVETELEVEVKEGGVKQMKIEIDFEITAAIPQL